MLSPEELLLFQAVKDEQERQDSMNMGGTVGAIGGALMGGAAGTIPHKIGNAINDLKGNRNTGANFRVGRALKPGHRLAGGLTGMILGGGLGAGAAALMKQESPAAQLLGKIQAQGGELDEVDQIQLGQMLGDIYNSPSQMM